MNEVSFVQREEPKWQRLTALCDKADLSPTRLNSAELLEFVELHRQVSSDLALARSQSSNTELVEFLNAIVGRSYGVLYAAPRQPFARLVADALATVARTVRRRSAYVLASAATLIGAALFAASLMSLRPDLTKHFIDVGDPNVKGWVEGSMPERTASESAMMTGFYSANNPKVALMNGAISASTFGIGSAWILWSNGTLIGALGTEMATHGRLGYLALRIAPHGATELTGAAMSGAAGYCMGWALIAPGRRSRGDALRAAGRDAFVLLALSIGMMFIAAPVEGFISFNPRVPDFAKAVFAITAFVAWMIFFVGYAREEPAPMGAGSSI